MTDIQLTLEAIEHLKALAQIQGISTLDSPDLQCIWDAKYVMGSHARTHITAQGKKFIQRYIEQH